ncbi:MAG: DUF4175 domain-containing protein, partial [Hyphococcus sp.]
MTSELATTPGGKTRRRKKRAPGAISIVITRLVIFWERLWPSVLPALAVPYLLLVVSLFGLWRHAPGWLHAATLVLAGAVFVSALWRDARRLRFPSRRSALARLEQDGGVRHAPLQALDDAPFDASGAGAALWRAHLRESKQRAAQARLAGVRKTADDADPYGLRYTALGLLAVAIIAAGGDWRPRLQAALSPGAGDPGRLLADIWIEPPDYTGKPPIYLMRPGDKPETLAEQINAPQGSRLFAQVNGGARRWLSFETPAGAIAAEFEKSGRAARAELSLEESGLVTFRMGGTTARWPLAVRADLAPTVSFAQAPAATENALLAFSMTAQDDYGITLAQFQFRLDPDQERPLDAPMFDQAALSAVRVMPIDGIAANAGEQNITLDLQEDPWAGLRVFARLVVTDGAGQTGASEEIPVTLPARPFFNPLAKAVIEQRQTLSVAAQDWRRAGRSLDALTLAPEAFYADDPTDYLMLRTAFWRVMRQTEDGYGDAVEKFWPLALQLEDEALELARQRLAAAEEALRQALENGASDEEIERLVEELRQAMNDYLTALAQSGERADPGNTQNAQQLDRSDLDEMLESIQ